MSKFKFDVRYLRSQTGSKMAEVDGKYIRNDRGSRVGEIDGTSIRDARGSRIGEFDGNSIRDGSGRKVSTIADVKKAIDGDGGTSLVALWLLFVR